ncbi:MAG: endonuclease domain-containing protein [Nitrospirae bacterium]|nr:endonuclease domain-containing protein [Nitrospirota bacterium]
MTKVFNKTSEKLKRRNLRQEMPKAEMLLWLKLRGKGLNGFKFRRQYSIGKFIVDFYCPQLKLAIEVDGDSHFTENAVKNDIERQKIIEAYGITFLRFTNLDIYENLEKVMDRIDIEMRKDTSPNPSL